MLVAASSTPPHPGANSRSSSLICPRPKLMRTLPNTSPRSSPARSPLVWRRRPSAQGYIPKIPLVSLPCLMHLGIARLVGILGRGRCIDDLRLRDDRIDDRASRNPQSVGCEVQLHLLEQRPVPCQDNRWPGREVRVGWADAVTRMSAPGSRSIRRIPAGAVVIMDGIIRETGPFGWLSSGANPAASHQLRVFPLRTRPFDAGRSFCLRGGGDLGFFP